MKNLSLGTKHQNRLLNALNAFKLDSHNSSILVAISGGPDSVYLAYLLHTLDFRFSLAHVNYGLRNKDSQFEEDLVVELADKWGVKRYIHRENPKDRMLESGESLQQIARKIRYDFFENCMQSGKYSHCAIAHHQDDQLESILISLLKGNNSRIIHGMPAIRGPYIRPLLGFRKDEILAGLKEAKLSYGHDISNDSNDYVRNQIRNQVLPLLAEINPSIKSQLLEKAHLYEEQKISLDHFLGKIYAKTVKEQAYGIISLDWSELKWDQKQLKSLCIYALEKWGLHGYELWQAVALINSMSGKFVEYKGGKIFRERNGLSKIPNTEIANYRLEESEVERQQEIELGNWSLKIRKVNEVDFSDPRRYFMDLDKLSFPLLFRTPKNGDKMKPLGMQQQKNLSDIMIDGKWSQVEKTTAILIADQDKICALINFRISDQVKLDKHSKNILEIFFREKES